jgi:hypothetical protein
MVMKSGFIHSLFEKKRSVPLFEKGRGRGIFFDKSPSIPLFQRGRCFSRKS